MEVHATDMKASFHAGWSKNCQQVQISAWITLRNWPTPIYQGRFIDSIIRADTNATSKVVILGVADGRRLNRTSLFRGLIVHVFEKLGKK
jgi:hypothetical protein